MTETKKYHPKRHSDAAIRLAYQDGWAEEKLGLKAPKRDVTGERRGMFVKAALDIGRREARGETTEGGFPDLE